MAKVLDPYCQKTEIGASLTLVGTPPVTAGRLVLVEAFLRRSHNLASSLCPVIIHDLLKNKPRPVHPPL